MALATRRAAWPGPSPNMFPLPECCVPRTRSSPALKRKIKAIPHSEHPSQIDEKGNAIPATNACRRTILGFASVGALYAAAGRSLAAADAAIAASSPSSDSFSRQLQSRVHEFSLSNSMRFLVYERRAAPVVSFHTYADVGAFDEVEGSTGVAHLLEHLAFKGTPQIGSKNFKEEAKLLDAVDDAFYSLRAAGNGREAGTLRARFEQLEAKAADLVIPNAYGALLQRQGAVGLNASTSHDATRYFCSLPSNKIELWFAMESERFQVPLFREVYREKKVVFEERRLRVDNYPLGPFQEEFAARSLMNNYRRPVIGYQRDLEQLGRREVAEFYKQHYGPKAITCAVVGDVRPTHVRSLAERYFGGWKSDALPGSPCNSGLETLDSVRPGASAQRSFSLRSRAGPAVLRAYYRPCIRERAVSTALDALDDALTGSRSARLYNNLVLGGEALSVSSFSSFPAEKHPSQFALYGIPAPGQSIENLDQMILQEVENAVGGITTNELRRYLKAVQTGLIEVLQSNSALASTLATYHALHGDWKEVYGELERIQALKPEDVAAAAGPILTEDNAFVGYVEPSAA